MHCPSSSRYPNRNKRASSPSHLKETALRILSRRDHSEYELIQKLLLKGFSREEIQPVMMYCQDYGYLDDLRYALSAVRQGMNKGHGERRIRQLLQQNRVADDVVNIALEQLVPDWFELAKQLAEKKFKAQPAIEAKEQAKRVRFLQSRGFSFEQIHYALSDQEETN